MFLMNIPTIAMSTIAGVVAEEEDFSRSISHLNYEQQKQAYKDRRERQDRSRQVELERRKIEAIKNKNSSSGFGWGVLGLIIGMAIGD